MSKHRSEQTYRPTFTDFFPSTPRGQRRTEIKEPDKVSNIDDWREEHGLKKVSSEFSIALTKEAA